MKPAPKSSARIDGLRSSSVRRAFAIRVCTFWRKGRSHQSVPHGHRHRDFN